MKFSFFYLSYTSLSRNRTYQFSQYIFDFMLIIYNKSIILTHIQSKKLIHIFITEQSIHDCSHSFIRNTQYCFEVIYYMSQNKSMLSCTNWSNSVQRCFHIKHLFCISNYPCYDFIIQILTKFKAFTGKLLLIKLSIASQIKFFNKSFSHLIINCSKVYCITIFILQLFWQSKIFVLLLKEQSAWYIGFIQPSHKLCLIFLIKCIYVAHI